MRATRITSAPRSTPIASGSGDVAPLTCATDGQVHAHIYWPELGWSCSHCGSYQRPEGPVEVPREQPGTTPTPPALPHAVRVRKMDGEVEVIPLSAWGGYEIVVRPFGGDPNGPERAVVRQAAHEIASVTFVYEGAKKP
jgi:hypothetical protein